jgi:hypothetical protein
LHDRDLLLIAGRLVGSAAFPIAPGTATVSPQMRQAIQTNPMEGSYVSTQRRFDNVQRFVSDDSSEKFGFVVNVGVTGATALAEWRTKPGSPACWWPCLLPRLPCSRC